MMNRSFPVAAGFAVAIMMVLVAGANAPAEEKLVVAVDYGVEVLDAVTLKRLDRSSVLSQPPAALAVTQDRRHLLISLASGYQAGSVTLLDLTRKGLPGVATFPTTLVVPDVNVSPDGKTAFVAGNSGITAYGEIQTLDLTQTPPAIAARLNLGPRSAFSIAITPDGARGFVADSIYSSLLELDLTRSPPVVARTLTLPAPGPVSVAVAPRGDVLLMPYSNRIGVWDVTSPGSPRRLPDLVPPANTGSPPSPARPIFEPGGSFAVVAGSRGVAAAPTLNVVAKRSGQPTLVGGIDLGPSRVVGLALTSDATTAYAALHPNQLQEVDVSNPVNPAMGRKVTWPFSLVGPIVSYGELHARGVAVPGGSLWIHIASPRDAGRWYGLAASTSTRPGIAIGSRRIPLNVDAVFLASRNLPAIFSGFSGRLSSAGQAIAAIHVPKQPALRGIGFHIAGVVLDPAAPFGINTVTNALHVAVH